jgi:hypothetical protein
MLCAVSQHTRRNPFSSTLRVRKVAEQVIRTQQIESRIGNLQFSQPLILGLSARLARGLDGTFFRPRASYGPISV